MIAIGILLGIIIVAVGYWITLEHLERQRRARQAPPQLPPTRQIASVEDVVTITRRRTVTRSLQ